jgi:tRNA-splicing ligase RtcB
MSRHEARRVLSVEEEIKQLEKQGVLHSIRSAKDLDEAPSAYKDISKVMDAQKDLVEIVTELSPLAVIKG